MEVVFTRIVVVWLLFHSTISEQKIQPSHTAAFQSTVSEKEIQPSDSIVSQPTIGEEVISQSVAFVQELNSGEEKSVCDGTSFFNFISTIGYVVDKTLFLKKVLKLGRNMVVITYPKRWGKSLNLNMMVDFFKMEIGKDGKRREQTETASYKLFSQGKIKLSNGQTGNLMPLLLISNHTSFIAAYAAQYPVFRISFGKLHKTDRECFIDSFREQIANIFIEWSPCILTLIEKRMENTTNENDLGTMKNEKAKYLRYKYEKVRYTKLAGSLAFLTSLFEKYLDSKVMIFVDEYDIIHNSIYFAKDTMNPDSKFILDRLEDFLRSTFKEESTQIRLSVFTGILNIARDDYSPVLGGAYDAHMFDDNVNPFYGFREEEVIHLLRRYQPNYVDADGTISEEVKLRYNGYLSNTQGEIFYRYNAYSVTRFIGSRGQLLDYYKDTGTARDTIIQFFNITKFRSSFFKMAITWKKEEFTFTELPFLKSDFDCLKSYIQGSQKLGMEEQYTIKKSSNFDKVEATDTIENLCTKFLLSHGYLTATLEDASTNTFLVMIPNLEMMNILVNLFIKYQAMQLSISFVELSNIANSIRDLTVFENTTCETLKKNFEVFLQHQNNLKSIRAFRIDVDQEIIFANEAFIHHVVTTAALRVRCSGKGFDIRLPLSGKRPDLVLIWPSKIVVMEIKFEDDVGKALFQAQGYTENLLYEVIYPEHMEIPPIEFKFKYIAVNVDCNKMVNIIHNDSLVTGSEIRRKAFLNSLQLTSPTAQMATKTMPTCMKSTSLMAQTTIETMPTSQPQYICRYHKKFGKEARFCVPSCICYTKTYSQGKITKLFRAAIGDKELFCR